MVRSALALASALVLAPVPCAAGGEWVDRSEIALTLGVLVFADAEFHDAGFIGGIEARVPVAPRWLVAGGISGGGDIGIFDKSLNVAPVEMDLVRVFPASSHFAAELGAGLAAVHGSHTDVVLFGDDIDSDGWVVGGQVSGGATAVFGKFLLGARIKYQVTGGFEDTGWGLDNVRVLARTGIAF